jgi:molybdate transport repressor ModE-like protein
VIETRHLRVLRAVSRTGSYSAAARELGCTQPAVSQQMKALEQAAGTPLVVRVGRETRLTEAGEALTRHAAGILAGLTAAEEEVAAIAGLRSGRVRMVSFPSGSSAIVPAAVAGMRAEHPGMKVSLEEAEPPRSIELLRSGDCEVALAFRYLGHDGSPIEGEWDDLVVRPLLMDRLIGIVPAGHRLARYDAGSPGAVGSPRPADDGAGARAVRLSELAEEPWIAGCPRCRRHLVDVCASEGFEPRIDFATDDYPAVVGLVAAGLGVAMLPELALRSIRPQSVAFLDVQPAIRREVVALTLPDLAHVPAVEGMLTRLAATANSPATLG